MKTYVIAVKMNRTTPEILRLLDIESNQTLDVSINQLINVIRTKNFKIENISLTGNTLKGSNGALSRYPIIGKPGNQPLTIIKKNSKESSYIVANADGKMLTASESILVKYAKQIGISNGKVVDNHISSINGQYEETTESLLSKEEQSTSSEKQSAKPTSKSEKGCTSIDLKSLPDYYHNDKLNIYIQESRPRETAISMDRQANQGQKIGKLVVNSNKENLLVEFLNIETLTINQTTKCTEITLNNCNIDKLIISEELSNREDEIYLELKHCKIGNAVISDRYKIQNIRLSLVGTCINNLSAIVKSIHGDAGAYGKSIDNFSYINSLTIITNELWDDEESILICDTVDAILTTRNKLCETSLISKEMHVGFTAVRSKTLMIRRFNIDTIRSFANNINFNMSNSFSIDSKHKEIATILRNKLKEAATIEQNIYVDKLDIRVNELIIDDNIDKSDGSRYMPLNLHEVRTKSLWIKGRVNLSSNIDVETLKLDRNIQINNIEIHTKKLILIYNNLDIINVLNNTKLFMDDIQVGASASASSPKLALQVSNRLMGILKRALNATNNPDKIINIKYKSPAKTYFDSYQIPYTIIDADKYIEEINKINKAANRELVLGVSALQEYTNTLDEIHNARKDNIDYINIEGMVNSAPEITDEVIIRLGLETKLAHKTAMQTDKGTYDFIDLMKTTYSFNPGPFDEKLYKIITSDADTLIDSRLHFVNDGISIVLFYIANCNMEGLDTYMIITSGHRLLHCCYVGSLNKEYISSVHYECDISKLFPYLSRIDTVDFFNGLINQTISKNIDRDKVQDVIEKTKRLINSTISIMDNKTNIVFLAPTFNYKGQKQRISYKASVENKAKSDIILNRKYENYKYARLHQIDFNEALKIHKESLLNQYQHSVTVQLLMSIQDVSGKLPEAEVASIYNIVKNDIDVFNLEVSKQNFSKLKIETVKSILKTEYFLEIDAEAYDRIKKSLDGRSTEYTCNTLTIYSTPIFKKSRSARNIMPKKWFNVEEIIRVNDSASGIIKYYMLRKYFVQILNTLAEIARVMTRTELKDATLEKDIQSISNYITKETMQKYTADIATSFSWHTNSMLQYKNMSSGSLMSRMVVRLDSNTGYLYMVMDLEFKRNGTRYTEALPVARIRNLEAALDLIDRTNIEEDDRALMNICNLIYNMGENEYLYSTLRLLQANSISNIDQYNKNENFKAIKQYIASKPSTLNNIYMKSYNMQVLDVLREKGFVEKLQVVPVSYKKATLRNQYRIKLAKYTDPNSEYNVYKLIGLDEIVKTEADIEQLFKD